MQVKRRSELNDFFRNLKYSKTFTELLDNINAGKSPLRLTGLEGSSKFLVISAIAHTLNRPVLYVCESKEKLLEAMPDLSFYSGETNSFLTKKEPILNEAIFSSLSKDTAECIRWLYFSREKKVILAEAPALFEKVLPVDVFFNSIISIKIGDSLSRGEFIARLIEMGYIQTDFIEEVGELSIRGSIVDVFSPGEINPIRLELLGDEIYSIRFFSIDNQRFIEKINEAIILPASEIILDPESIRNSLNYIEKKASQDEIPASVKNSLIEEIKKGIRSPQINLLLPSFYPNLSTVFEYLPKETIVVLDSKDDVSKSIEVFDDTLVQNIGHLQQTPTISPKIDELYITKDEYWNGISMFQTIHTEDVKLRDEDIANFHLSTEPMSKAQIEDLESPFDAVANKISDLANKEYTVNIVLRSEVERNMINKILGQRGIKNFETFIGPLSSGYIFPEAKLVVITEEEIFEGRKKTRQRSVKNIPSAFITSFSELKPGDHIVHIDFGIGLYRGLKRLRFGNMEGDFLHCEYQGGDKIYVPVDKLKLVQRYIGDKKNPRIDKLGQQNWKRVIKRVKKAVENIARELIQIYARRKAEKGYKFSKRDKLFREFEYEFPYEETLDQTSAIEDVMKDMESNISMDRLICGDVGFGKTEVALRAAFKAVMDGKQVAFLVPTTLLAYQHYLTSIERLKGYPVFTEMLSRFKTQKEEKEILNKLEKGNIDIIIGTHKILGNKIQFKNLGLVIVDEEHRFGVSQKEKLRKKKTGVDVLTLSATPIPRTLQLSLTGIRDISMINTPPEGRQSIETYILNFKGHVIRNAILKELKRGGSVFFIHNRIEDIFNIAEEIKKLVPEARVDVTHGRMKEQALENSINKFIQGNTDILVTTAIVESGLDIPIANTMIINNAQKFGLADLYQLRGRVGRTDKKAYSYFLIPRSTPLSSDAKRRLKAISELKDLGSGYKLALSDLEIRGAGNIFGTEQSGHIADVGLELYLEILDKSIRELKKEQTFFEYDPEIRFNFPAFIPDDYIEDGTERLLFYKKLSNISKVRELRSIKEELRDRFGNIPKPGANLLYIVELKIIMKKLLIDKMDIDERKAVIVFRPDSALYNRFQPEGKLRIFKSNGDLLIDTKKRLRELIKVAKNRKKLRH